MSIIRHIVGSIKGGLSVIIEKYGLPFYLKKRNRRQRRKVSKEEILSHHLVKTCRKKDLLPKTSSGML